MKVGYVDGFVLVVPKKNMKEYAKMAKEAGKVWKKHGALDYKECWGEDLKPDMSGMPVLTFPKLTKMKPGETVVFSYITYKSRAHRDKVNAKVIKEMEKAMDPNMKMPFDTKKMAYGGFKVLVGF
ncbi:MAG TPA: DUF1428 domain-containing protein [Candidatus Bilamarchaeum sp.]|nr:DUF1428 domain-containing protein [Candidatus Bilamarchaeum sp.]